jgi:hypothetical protein
MSEPNADGQSPVPAESAIKPIPYATPGPRTNPGVIPVKGRLAIGCFGYVLLSIFWFVGFSYLGTQYVTAHGLSPYSALHGWVLMTIGLLGISLWLRLKFGYKGYGYGILSALGAAALLLLGLFLLLLAICGPTGGGAGHSSI